MSNQTRDYSNDETQTFAAYTDDTRYRDERGRIINPKYRSSNAQASVVKPKRSHIAQIIMMIVGVAAIIVSGSLLILFTQDGTPVDSNHAFSFDSGYSACVQIAQNAKKGTDDSNGTGKMTKAELAEKEAPFKLSKYNDLKVAGVNVMETVYKMDNATDDFAVAMGDLSVLTAQWGQLQTACANHGAPIPSLNFEG